MLKVRHVKNISKKTFGELSKDYGYKDLIPLFIMLIKFNADEWAELFVKSGAAFAGSRLHHDGFAMIPTLEWKCCENGPKRDVKQN